MNSNLWKLHKALIIGIVLAGWVWPKQGIAQWQTSGSEIYYNSGNVGIGTDDPQKELHVAGSALINGTLKIEQTSYQPAAALLFFFDRSSNNATDRNWKIATLPASSAATGDKLHIELFGGNHSSVNTFQQIIHLGNRNDFNGYVRTTYGKPHESVRVRAYKQEDESVDIYLSILSSSWKGGSVRIYEGSAIVVSRPVIYQNPANEGAAPTGTLIFDSFSSMPGLIITNDNEIGIGTTNPTAKLAVNGVAKAKEMIVTEQGSDWPDYVFDEDFELNDLAELETFIQQNKHLPDLPTKEEVEKDGQNVGRVQSAILKQLEELVLHTIELKKENRELREDIRELKLMLNKSGALNE